MFSFQIVLWINGQGKQQMKLLKAGAQKQWELIWCSVKNDQKKFHNTKTFIWKTESKSFKYTLESPAASCLWEWQKINCTL